MIESYVRNPVKVTVGVLLVVLFGVIGLFRMPMQLTPEVQIPTITIETRWPGASPGEVEKEIIIEQEEQLKSVEGIVKMTSASKDSVGTIVLEFPVGTDMSEALLKVNTRLQQVQSYPEDADEPIISAANSGDRPIAWFILRPRVIAPEAIRAFVTDHPALADKLEPAIQAPNSGMRIKRLQELANDFPVVKELLPPSDMDATTYRKFAEDFIEARFERVPGVANANVLGGREEELQVVINPEKLAARQLTIADVRMALQGANKDTSAGDVWEGKRRWVIRTLGLFRSPDQVLKVLVAYREGAPVYIRDVVALKEDGRPRVELGYKKPDGIVKQFGQTSIAINAQRAVGANVLDVMTGLRRENEALNRGILQQRGLQLEQVYDETDYIYSSVDLVQTNILIGGLLTVAVLLTFLRSVRSTLVIAVAIPSSIIGTFLVLSILGRSLNVVSLAGIAFAVGMLVDNAVVVLENIYQHYQRGKSPFRAAVDGACEVQGAVLASTLTTLAVFIPVLFVEEQAGQLFRDIALAVSGGVALSLIVSLTVIPMASARLLQKRPRNSASATDPARNGRPDVMGSADPGNPLPSSSGLNRLFGPIDVLASKLVGGLMALNRWLQSRFLARLAVVVGFVGLAIAASWLLMPKVEYLPSGNRNLVFGILLPPPGYNLDQLVSIGERIEESLQPYWDIDPTDPRSNPNNLPAIKDFFFVARDRQVFMGVKAVDDLRANELVEVVQNVITGVPGTIGFAQQSSLFEQGLTAGRTIDIEINGPDVDKLLGLAVEIFVQIPQVVPGARAIPQPSLDKASPEVHVRLRREQAAELGVTDRELGYWVNALVDGAYATDFYKGNTKIDLSIVGGQRFAQRTQDVRTLPIAVPTGDLVTIGSVADVKISSGPEQINHVNRLRNITIQVSPPPEIPIEQALEDIQRTILSPIRERGVLGEDYQFTLAGTVDDLRKTWDALGLNFLLALLITYLLMAGLFESWLYPFVVILSVPLGALGGFIGLYVLNLFVLQPLDVLTMLGFVILIGTVVNNPILIVEQALINLRAGKDYTTAVLEATRARIRPIFMTTMTTVLGLLPLVVMPGSGSELYRGLGSVLLGGLMVSAFVTLVLVPNVFTLTLQTQQTVRRWLGLSTSMKDESIEEDQEIRTESVGV